jgi:hypothetical protein
MLTNFITGVPVPPVVAGLQFDKDFLVDAEDPVYYYLRTESDIMQAGLSPFSYAKNPLLTDSSTAVHVSDGAILESKDLMGVGVKEELEFLQNMGLAFMKEDSWYILPHAAQFYHSVNGLFLRDKDGVTAEDVKPFYTLMLHYVLPGRYWATYMARDGLALPESVAYATKLDQDMNQTVRDYNDLLLKNPNVE